MERKFDFEIDLDTWSRVKVVTKETRLKVLHWNILHNIYPSNIMLNKMKVTENNKYALCPDKVDFIEHFFCECPTVKLFWKNVK